MLRHEVVEREAIWVETVSGMNEVRGPRPPTLSFSFVSNEEPGEADLILSKTFVCACICGTRSQIYPSRIVFFPQMNGGPTTNLDSKIATFQHMMKYRLSRTYHER